MWFHHCNCRVEDHCTTDAHDPLFTREPTVIPCYSQGVVPRLISDDGLLESTYIAAGRDGRTFRRYAQDSAFVPRGHGRLLREDAADGQPAGTYAGSFDAGGTALAAGILDINDEETVMLAWGSQTTHNTGSLNGTVRSGLQVMRTRRHGFVSMHPTRTPSERSIALGTFLTRKLQLPTCERLRLELNLQTDIAGRAQIELTTITNTSILSEPLLGNSAHFEARWLHDSAEESIRPSYLPMAFSGAQVTARMTLAGEGTHLYGFQFVCE